MKKVTLAVVIALLATSCSSRSEQANTVGGQASTSVTVEAPESAAGAFLTQAQAQSVLPTAGDVGPDWSIDNSAADEDDSNSGTYSDPECGKLFESLSTADENSDWGRGAPAVRAEATFKQNAEEMFSVNMISFAVSSYESTVPDDAFDEMAAVFDRCNHFSITDGGVSSTFDVLPLSMPNYGDNTYSMKIQGGVGVFIIVIDVVFVAVGHNIVTATNMGMGGLDSELLPRLLEQVMTNLENV